MMVKAPKPPVVWNGKRTPFVYLGLPMNRVGNG